ncbi:MAG: serine/threonine-protein kinase [Archangium sp.]
MPGTDPTLGGGGNDMPSVQVENADPLIGIELGGYTVVRLLAAGGMGLVYEALHQQIGRRAAVKVLKPEVAADAEWTKRFLSEARALGSLKHRNLIEVLNFGKTPDGREYLMMEFLDGEPLDAYIQRMGALAPAAALGIADQILNGLAEAHKKGVVHRDLKPSNVYLQREHNGELLVKVLDFGLARQEPVALLDGAITLPKRNDGASLLAGTPEYIAPEQAQGRTVDGAADMYSLGVMLFEMMTGSLPFEAESVTDLLRKHLSERPPRLSTVMNNPPEGVEEFIESLLAKEPSQRPSSADAARVSVQRLLKRLSQDSTNVRSLASLEAEADPKRAPTMRIDRPQHTTDTALAAAGLSEKKERKVWPWIVAAIAIILLLLMLPSLFKREPEVTPPPPEVAVVKPPEVKPEVIAQPSKPVIDDEVVPLPAVKPNVPPAPVAVAPKTTPEPKTTPKLTIKPSAPTAVAIEKSDCVVNDEWRATMAANLQELGRIAAAHPDSKKYDLFETNGRLLSQKVAQAQTVDDCVAANSAFSKLLTDVRK